MKLTILGCGPSSGVPLIGCDCAVCTSDEPKNRRQRASALFETDAGAQILIDASPDLRNQALQVGLSKVDALILTHAHADHCHGLDDMRSFNFQRGAAIDLYADAATLSEVQQRFAYVFEPHIHEYGWYKPEFHCHTVADGTQQLEIAGQEVTLFTQHHGRVNTLGIRMGTIAYSTDVKTLDDAAFAALEGVELLVVDCLRKQEAPTHAHLELTLEWIARLKPKRAILTHMGHDFDYRTFNAELPEGVEMAYDGMVLSA